MCWLKLLISTGGEHMTPIFLLALHGNVARIGSDWKLSGAQKPVQSAEGNVCMKASNLCSRKLPRSETITAKVAAHQASGFSAFSTSNYLWDHTFRKPSDIWPPINLSCLRFSIFYLLLTVRLHCIIYSAVASRCWGRWIKVLHGFCFKFRCADVVRLHQTCIEQNDVLQTSCSRI